MLKFGVDLQAFLMGIFSMSILRNGFSAVGKLLVGFSLLVAFVAGALAVVYIQLRGEEISIPKVVGKNFNEGKTDLIDKGLRIKRVSSRYSNEEPDTILEQRPRAGTTAKTGLMISVVVSEKNPDGNELPVEIKDDEEAIQEIEDQPEFKIEKKKKTSTKPKKTSRKTRDVIKSDEKETKPTESETSTKETKPDPRIGESLIPTTKPKTPTAPKPTAQPKKPAAEPKPTKKPPAKAGDTRKREVSPSN